MEKKMNRREFVKCASAAVVSLIIPPAFAKNYKLGTVTFDYNSHNENYIGGEFINMIIKTDTHTIVIPRGKLHMGRIEIDDYMEIKL